MHKLSLLNMCKPIGFLLFFVSLFFVSSQNVAAGIVIDGRFDDKSSYTFLGPAGNNAGEVYFDITSNALSIAVILTTEINDTVFEEGNTAYVNSVGWGNHDFKKLFKSDHLELILDCDGTVTAWSQDYLHRSDSDDGSDGDANSMGWLSTPDGPNGSGNPTFVNASESSMTYNLNDLAFAPNSSGGLTPRSPESGGEPPGHPAIAMTNPLGPAEDSGTDWFWNIFYEMEIDIKACGGTPLFLGVASSHNSNSKTDEENTPLCVDEQMDPICDFGDPGPTPTPGPEPDCIEDADCTTEVICFDGTCPAGVCVFKFDETNDPSCETAERAAGPVTIIPTMGQWGMIIAAAFLGIFAIIRLRSRKDSELN